MFQFLRNLRDRIFRRGEARGYGKHYIPRHISKLSPKKRKELAREGAKYRKPLEKSWFGTFSPIGRFRY